MAQGQLTDAQIAEFREMFDLMDKDKGGTLAVDEIKQLMDMLGMKIRPDELDTLVAEIDTDGSGQVDFDEFLQVMARPQNLPYNRTDVLRAFQMFARPEDPPGLIHPDVLEEALVKYASDKCTPEEALRLVNTLELNANGLIDFDSKVKLFVSK